MVTSTKWHTQLGFCAESKELETWLKHCHDRLKREHSLPSRHDAAWLHEFDRIEQVTSPSPSSGQHWIDVSDEHVSSIAPVA